LKCLQALVQSRAAKTGHNYVGDQQFDGAGIIAGDSERFLRRSRFKHDVAGIAKDFRECVAERASSSTSKRVEGTWFSPVSVVDCRRWLNRAQCLFPPLAFIAGEATFVGG
jgi:hypothetical protein